MQIEGRPQIRANDVKMESRLPVEIGGEPGFEDDLSRRHLETRRVQGRDLVSCLCIVGNMILSSRCSLSLIA